MIRDVTVPGDKSIAHRALILAALARGTSEIHGLPDGADVLSTIAALRRLGVGIEHTGTSARVRGTGALRGGEADCGNSGTTMRLLCGALAGQPVRVRLHGDASLSRRPMRRVAAPLREMGVTIETTDAGTPPLVVSGTRTLRAIDYTLPVASGQVKTALLIAALAAEGTTIVRGRIDGRDHGERMLPLFGATLRTHGNAIAIPGRQALTPARVDVPGDPSTAAVWFAAAAFSGGEVRVRNVGLNPTRIGFLRVLERMNAHVEIAPYDAVADEPAGDVVVRGGALVATTVGGDEIPSLIDELPLVALVATQAEGTTIVRDAAELRVKESDRIEAIASVLRALGAGIETSPDGFAVAGPTGLRGAAVDAHADHRIAMMAMLAGLRTAEPVAVNGAEAVAVSYPAFPNLFAELTHA